MAGDAPPGYECDPVSGVCRKVEDGSTGPNANVASVTPLESLLGDTLLMGTNKVPTSSIVTPGKVVGLYFSAHWCPPCRMFTPFLSDMYKNFKEKHVDKGKFDVVFVSSDKDESSFSQYYGEMPWLAVPFERRDVKTALSRKFKVQGIPTLIILDGETGQVINANGREAVSGDEKADNFPWRPKAFKEIIAGELVDKSSKTSPASEVLAGKIKLLYFSAHWCPPCRSFTPQLISTYEKLKAANKNFEVVFVSSDRDAAQFNEYLHEMPWLAVPYEDRAKKGELSSLFDIEGIPSLVVLDENDQIITANGRGAVAQDPDGNDFPWAPKPVDLLNEFTVNVINDAPTVVFALEAEDQHQAGDRAQTVLLEVAKTAKASTSDDIFFLFGLRNDDLTKRVLEFTGIGESSDDSVFIVDIPSQKVYIMEEKGALVTSAAVSQFVTSFLAGSLTGKPLGDE